MFVAGIARSYSFPFHSHSHDKDNIPKSNFQAMARAWRQSESSKLLVSNGFRDAVIATAHHLDDQTETTLLKLVRGTHLSNLHPVSLCDSKISFIMISYRCHCVNGGIDDAKEWQ